jgi:hypothetical protein
MFQLQIGKMPNFVSALLLDAAQPTSADSPGRHGPPVPARLVLLARAHRRISLPRHRHLHLCH